MKVISKFTIQEHRCAYENRPLKSALFFDGVQLKFKTTGYVIEKQFEFKNYYLLFLNWDCSFEEGCEVLLINKQLELVGSYSFKPFYNSFNLSSVCEVKKDHYRIVFDSTESYELVVNYPKKCWFSRVLVLKKYYV